MLYRAAADTALVLHAGFVLFVMLGGLWVLRWTKVAWLHVPAVMWAAVVEFTGRICPLTPLEVALRTRAGEAGYAGDFVEHYIGSLLYPDGLARDAQTVLGALVVVVNAIIYIAVVMRERRGASP